MQPSQVGIELSTIGFETFVGDVMIAPVSSTGMVILAPTSTSELSLVGRLVPQDSPAGLSAVSGVFNNFVQGKDSNVVVHGKSAGPQDVRLRSSLFCLATSLMDARFRSHGSTRVSRFSKSRPYCRIVVPST